MSKRKLTLLINIIVINNHTIHHPIIQSMQSYNHLYNHTINPYNHTINPYNHTINPYNRTIHATIIQSMQRSSKLKLLMTLPLYLVQICQSENSLARTSSHTSKSRRFLCYLVYGKIIFVALVLGIR